MAKPAASKHVRKEKGRINPAEWPKISKRRLAGETYAAIAADYGVTAAAIWFVCAKTAKPSRGRPAKPAASKTTASRTNGSKVPAKHAIAPMTVSAIAARLKIIETSMTQNLNQLVKVRDVLISRERPHR